MPSELAVCLYFQVHQPARLRRYSVFDTAPDYFDDERNADVFRKVLVKSYLPTFRLLLDLVTRYGGGGKSGGTAAMGLGGGGVGGEGGFRFGLSLSGCVLDQFEAWGAEGLDLLRQLAATGAVEFLAETAYHSLASLYSPAEFETQVRQHHARITALFGRAPTVFRNTELIFSDDIARAASTFGYAAALAEGADRTLNGRTPNTLYKSAAAPDLRLLLKNYGLSDDIAFRFSDRNWEHWPLSPKTYASWIDRSRGDGPLTLVNLFMDLETFGEHQWADTGIFAFLDQFPAAIFALPHARFVTPAQASTPHHPQAGSAHLDSIAMPHPTSWADTERDVSAWLGNAMQVNASHELYRLEPMVKAANNPQLLTDWRRLTTSDHVYYMSTKDHNDGAVHGYFSPYESPYDAYINFMNVLDDVTKRAIKG